MPSCSCRRRSLGSGMPSSIAAAAGLVMPLILPLVQQDQDNDWLTETAGQPACRSLTAGDLSLPPQGGSEGPRNLHLPHSTASRTRSYIRPSLRSGHTPARTVRTWPGRPSRPDWPTSCSCSWFPSSLEAANERSPTVSARISNYWTPSGSQAVLSTSDTAPSQPDHLQGVTGRSLRPGLATHNHDPT